jgi:hypothetical protein
MQSRRRPAVIRGTQSKIFLESPLSGTHITDCKDEDIRRHLAAYHLPHCDEVPSEVERYWQQRDPTLELDMKDKLSISLKLHV